jgi:hypothetical protein
LNSVSNALGDVLDLYQFPRVLTVLNVAKIRYRWALPPLSFHPEASRASGKIKSAKRGRRWRICRPEKSSVGSHLRHLRLIANFDFPLF